MIVWTELRLRRWTWCALLAAVLGLLGYLLRGAHVPLPIALRLISAPEVLAIILVAVTTYPLLDWLPGLPGQLRRERTLRTARIAVSLALTGVPLLPAQSSVPHLAAFCALLWMLTVAVTTFASGPLAWLVPVTGGMAMFIADGGDSAPISAALVRTDTELAITAATLAVAACYIGFGPRPTTAAEA